MQKTLKFNKKCYIFNDTSQEAFLKVYKYVMYQITIKLFKISNSIQLSTSIAVLAQTG